MLKFRQNKIDEMMLESMKFRESMKLINNDYDLLKIE